MSPDNSLVTIVPILWVRKQRPREIKKPGRQWGSCQSPCPRHEVVILRLALTQCLDSYSHYYGYTHFMGRDTEAQKKLVNPGPHTCYVIIQMDGIPWLEL